MTTSPEKLSPIATILLPGEPLDANSLREQLSYPECGSLLMFEGIVREMEDGRPLEGLHYEAHPVMAEQQLLRLLHDQLQQQDIRGIGCQHRTGLVRAQEASIVVVIASDHRAAGFAAIASTMDRLKEVVPIWKSPRYK